MLARFDLDGRSAVVTGAGGGIGRACAVLLAEAGASILAVDLPGEHLDETAAVVRERGGQITAVAADVSDAGDVDRIMAAARGLPATARLAVLANVAGVVASLTIEDTPPEEFDRVLGVNLRGTFLCCRAAVAAMREAGPASIVNVSSSIVARAVPGYGAYAVSKGGVIALTKSLAVELAPLGIRANAVAPGLTITPMTMNRRTPEERRRFLAESSAAIPLGRVADPEDIAYAVVYLASDASSFVTGQTLYVNGGTVMPS
jgi:3-oxoacyl-[acyl-carrier protein] reductase